MFIAFSGMTFEQAGGMSDCDGVYTTIEAAIKAVSPNYDDPHYFTSGTYWAEIYEVRADGLWSVWSNGEPEEPSLAHALGNKP